MRAGWIFAVLFIAGCAGQRMTATPLDGADLSGHWRLNAAESDDPQGLIGEASVVALVDAMRWPGKDLVIKQLGGVVAFSSDGESRVCQPSDRSLAAVRAPRGRDQQPVCGWDGAALLVETVPDDGGRMLEDRYRVSADHQHLVQRIRESTAGGGHVDMVRVWDRVP